MRILKNMLMRGFTTVRDAGGADFGLARAIDEGYATGPRLLFCGKALSQTGGHGDMRSPGENFESCLCCAGLGRVCDGVSEVRKACRDEIRKGATHIKIMASGGVASPTDRISSSQFSLDEISAAVEEANNANIYVLAHAYLPKSISRALECGVRSIEHGNMIDSQSSAIMIEKNAFLVPTMSTHEILPIEGLKAGMPAEMLEKVAAVTEAGKINFPNAWKQGVRMVFGTDLLGTMHEHQLLEFALRGEFQKPIDVIRSATNVAADLFQMSDNIGQIKPGAFADIISVKGNPLEDLGILQKPTKFLKLIIKGGKIYKNEY
jgi:imidazolonepropionase-like amidohydrolase